MPHPHRPLAVTADPVLLDDLLRLAAAAGVELDVAADVAGARRGWRTAPLVILGDDVTSALADRPLPRRDDVVIVGLDLDDADVWERGVAVGAEQVLFLPDAEQWLVDRLTDVLEGSGDRACTVSVVGGRGGAGASTLATALAVTGMRRGLRVLLADCDPFGGGIDMLLDGEDAHGMRWPDLTSTRGRVNARALRHALPQVDELTVLSWDRSDVLTIPPEAMQTVLRAAQRSSDLVIADLPRRPDPASEIVLAGSDVTLLLVPAEVRATAAAGRVAAAVGLLTGELQVVVRGPAPAGLPPDAIAEALGLPLAGALRPEPGLAEALERGEPPGRRGRGPLAAFCSDFLAAVLPGNRTEIERGAA